MPLVYTAGENSDVIIVGGGNCGSDSGSAAGVVVPLTWYRGRGKCGLYARCSDTSDSWMSDAREYVVMPRGRWYRMGLVAHMAEWGGGGGDGGVPGKIYIKYLGITVHG